MQRITVCAFMMLLLLVSPAQADYIQQRAQGGEALYEVVNHFFLQGQEDAQYRNNFELLLSSILPGSPISLVADAQQTVWNSGNELRLEALYRDTASWQGFGYTSDGVFNELADCNTYENSSYARPDQEISFGSQDGSLVWTNTIGGYGLERITVLAREAYSARGHYLTFAINDETLLTAFEDLYGLHHDYFEAGQQVWLVAFDGLDIGSRDYTDLVAIVSSDITQVPVPGTLVLLASALMVSRFRIGARRRTRV